MRVRLGLLSVGMVLVALLLWSLSEVEPSDARAFSSQDAKSASEVAVGSSAVPSADAEEAFLARSAINPLAETISNIPSIETPPDDDLDLHGVVLGPMGETITDAEVVVHRAWARDIMVLDLEYNARRTVIGVTRTNAAGEFRMRVEPGLLYELEAHHQDAISPLYRDCTAGEFVRVRIAPAASLRGIVTDAETGARLQDLDVRIFQSGGSGLSREVTTDATGEFRFDGLPAMPWTIEVRPVTHEAPPWTKVELLDGEETVHSFALSPGRTIRGQVLEEGSGIPIAGAEIADSWTFRRTNRTDAQGAFEIRGLNLDEDWSELYVRAPGYAKREFLASELDLDGSLEILLAPAWTVHGTLLTADGVAADGAYIAVAGSEHGGLLQRTQWSSATVDAEGGFELRDLRTDIPLVLFARMDGHGTLFTRIPPQTPGRSLTDLGTHRLLPACSVTGSLLVTEEAVAPNVEAELVGPDLSAEDPQLAPSGGLGHYLFRTRTRTDDRGRFRFVSLRDGNYELFLKPEGAPAIRLPIALRAGQQLELSPIVQGQGLSIRGSVVDDWGAPISGANVSVRLPGPPHEIRVSTDAAGAFEFRRMAEGQHELNVYTRNREGDSFGYRPLWKHRVTAGDQNIVITMHRCGWIQGTVLASGGFEAAHCDVRARSTDGTEVGSAIAESSGEFRILVPVGTSVRLEFHPMKLLPGREAEAIRIRAGSEPAATLESVPEGAKGLRVPLQ